MQMHYSTVQYTRAVQCSVLQHSSAGTLAKCTSLNVQAREYTLYKELTVRAASQAFPLYTVHCVL